MNESVVASLFYVSIGLLVFGLIRALRASVERKVRDVRSIVLAAIGGVGLLVAVILYLNGPRTMIPF
jgi:predicted membrane channel-forming protein YqfA (hemolysin III family)